MSVPCPHCGSPMNGARCDACGQLADDAVPVAAAIEDIVPEADIVDVEEYDDEVLPVEAVPVEAVAVEAVPVAHSAHGDTAHHHGKPLKEAVNAMNFGSDDDESEALEMKKAARDDSELDMTPMVDVTFLLLIFFMVTASFALQKSIEMPNERSNDPSPITDNSEDEEADVVTVRVDEFNSFTVLAADWEREVPGKQNLIRALTEAKPDGVSKLKIEVHENAVVEAMVDVMDAGAIVGYSELEKTEIKN